MKAVDRIVFRLSRALFRRRDYVNEYAVPRDQVTGSGEVARLFIGHDSRIAYKVVHYFELYQRHFERFQGTPVRMLEIGVFYGGSLEIWRKYFGPQATIFGIDIDPECAGRFDPPNAVRIGSQADREFLRAVAGEMGGLDIVLDDGSHVASHQRASFDVLWPLLSDGGLYVIEDMCTSYWRDHGGGYRRRGTAVEMAKGLIDSLHGWWHEKPVIDGVVAVHAYDSIAFIEKGRSTQPRIAKFGH